MKACVRPITITSLFIFLFFSLPAQKDSSATRHFFFATTSYQWMHTTHTTIINGGAVDVNYALSPHVALGLGVQYASAPLHNDNDWVLTKLRFVPVYFNNIFSFWPHHRLHPYFHAEEGVSFNSYNKLDLAQSPQPFKVREAGLYLSGNFGGLYTITKRLGIFAEIGYKGYKHSFDEYDINPHGITLRGGIQF